MAQPRKLNNGWAFFLIASLCACAYAACPPPPVQCASKDCHLTNFRGLWEDESSCRVANAIFPKTEDELLGAVADAVKKGRKMKVVGAGSHSFNRFACPSGDGGIVISTRDYNSRIIVDEKSLTVTVDAGVGLRTFIDTLASKGLALPQTTDWDFISMAGIVSTAAHGSGLWGKGGGVHEYVVGMSLVVPAPANEGYAKLLHLTNNDEDLKAARVSLGVLGAISQLTFKVEKMFKRSVTLDMKDDSDLEDAFVKFAEAHEFGEINWYPSLHQVVYTIRDRVPVEVSGNGKNSNPAFQPMTVQSVVQSRTIEEEIYATRDTGKLCNISKIQVTRGVKTGNGYLNDGLTFKGYPVIGYNHLMQASSGCQGNPSNASCPWEAKQLEDNDTICNWDTQVHGSLFFQSSIAIPLSRIAEAIADIKRLRDIDPSLMCGIDYYMGVHMRYFKKSEDYLSHTEDSVDFEFLYFRYREPGRPRWNEHVMEEMEQMLLHKYEGVPHWGKNRVYTFQGAAQRTVNLDKFLEVKKRLDPHGFFSSKWSDGVLGIGKHGVEIWRDGCALDGLCICNEDRHCAPEKGFFCKPGRVWKKARVCKQQ
eukprot:PITA_08350